MTQRVLVLMNPRSGSSRRRIGAEIIRERLRSQGAMAEIAAPSTVSEMQRYAMAARREEHEVLLVSGGDGSLSVVVNGLIKTPMEDRPTLGILPTGRGNDFAAELGIFSVDDAFRALSEGRSRLVDLGRTEASVFLGVAGTGFDARVARRARETPLLSGSLLYTFAVLRTLLDFHPLSARIRYEGGAYEGTCTFVAVGNASRYGGGMRITPRADLADGLLDLCLVREISRRTLLGMLPAVFSGSHLSHPSVEYRKSPFVEIETEERAEVFADGEYLQPTPVRIDVRGSELRVLTLLP